MADHTFLQTPELTFGTFEDQTITGRLTLGIHVIKTPAYNNKAVILSLASSSFNTLISPGVMKYNESSTIGYYFDRIEIKMWFDEPFMRLIYSTPTAVDSSGSVSSSLAVTLGGSAGFFGLDPTANVNGSVSVNNSCSRSIQDFTLVDQTFENTLYHVYKMTQCKDGASYSNPTDLLNTSQNPFVGTELRGVPQMAYSDFPLTEQGIWQTLDDRVYNDMLTLRLQITLHIVKFEATNNFLYYSTQVNEATRQITYATNINLAGVD